MHIKRIYIIPIYVYISDHTNYNTSYTWSFMHDDSLSFYISVDMKFIIYEVILYILPFMLQHSQFVKMNIIDMILYIRLYKSKYTIFRPIFN